MLAMPGFHEQFQEIQRRLDSSITYTLVNYFETSLQKTLDSRGIYYACFFTFFSAYVIEYLRTGRESQMTQVCEMTKNFSVLVFVQHISNSATSLLGASNTMHPSSMSMHIAMGCSVLILAAIIPHSILDMPLTQNTISLLLFIVTDSVSKILNLIEMGILGVLISLLAIVCIKMFHSRIYSPVMEYILKLLDMIIVNVMIISIASIDKRNIQNDVQAALMIIFLFAIDIVRHYNVVFENARNYAVWKISRQISATYRKFDVDAIALIYLGLVIVILNSFIFSKQTTLAEVSMLITVNQILNSINTRIQEENSAGEFILLIFYIILIHTTQRIFL